MQLSCLNMVLFNMTKRGRKGELQNKCDKNTLKKEIPAKFELVVKEKA